jgi:hypothetical protein
MEKTMNMDLNPSVIENKIYADLEKQAGHNMRASLFNLLFFYDISKEPIVSDLLEYLFGKRPARILHIQQTRDEQSGGYVKVRCYPDSENNQVCFQEIIIRNGRDNRGSASGTWAPLLTRDIPVIAIWLNPLQPFPALLHTAASLADKIIICSETNEALGESPPLIFGNVIRELISPVADSGGNRPVVSDLTWFASLTLRQETALVFEKPEMRRYLTEITEVSLYGVSRSKALLYLLWLASRLDWKIRDPQASEPLFTDGKGGTIAARFAMDEHAHVVITTAAGNRIPIPPAPDTTIQNPGPVHGITSMGPCIINDRHGLLNELDTIDPDPLYYEALKRLE